MAAAQREADSQWQQAAAAVEEARRQAAEEAAALRARAAAAEEAAGAAGREAEALRKRHGEDLQTLEARFRALLGTKDQTVAALSRQLEELHAAL